MITHAPAPAPPDKSQQRLQLLRERQRQRLETQIDRVIGEAASEPEPKERDFSCHR